MEARKKHKEKRIFILLLLLTISARGIIPDSVFASSCAEDSLERAAEKATAIFSGKVTEVYFPEPRHAALISDPKLITGDCGDKYVTFVITQQWKGASSDIIKVFSSDGCVGLGGYFTKGEDYLVYAYSHDDELATTVCGRTKTLHSNAAQKDIKNLTLLFGKE